MMDKPVKEKLPPSSSPSKPPASAAEVDQQLVRDFAALMESHVANAAEITIFAPKVEMMRPSTGQARGRSWPLGTRAHVQSPQAEPECAQPQPGSGGA